MINLQTRELVLKWTKKGKTQQQIADLVGCNQSAISRLIVKYNKTGNVKNLPRSGRPTPLTKNTLAKLKTEFKKKAREANKNYSTRHVERILHRLNFSRITPRSQHIKNDQAKVNEFRMEFKKKS